MLILNTNLKSANATTQYHGFQIDSMCKTPSGFFVASPAGLMRYYGETDNTQRISAYFVTATMDFGINNDKRLRYVYLSLESVGDLALTVHTEKVAAQVYPVRVLSGVGQQDVRISIARSLHGRFWTFSLSNGMTGADFSIDEIKVLPIVRGSAH